MPQNLMENVTQSKATSAGGIAAMLIAIGNALHQYDAGGLEGLDWNTLMLTLIGFAVGAIGLFSRE